MKIQRTIDKIILLFIFNGLIGSLALSQPVAQTDLIQIVAVGDVMLGTSFPVDSSKTPPDTSRFLPPNNGKHLLQAVTPDLVSADIAFCNLEGGFLNGGKPRKQCSDPDRCYLFRMPEHYVHHLVTAGFDVVSLANNHARDFIGGMDRTMKLLDEVGIAHSGRLGDIASWEVKNKKVALLAFAPYEGLYDLRETEFAAWKITQLKQKHDLVLVSFHGGAEGSRAMHVPDSVEYYYGENRGHLRKFTHRMIEAGADLLIGHGPHVPRGLELYNHRLIAYSLGNFCTYERFNLKGHNGVTLMLQIKLAENGEFQGGKIIACKQEEPGIPVYDESGQAVKLLSRLSRQDFPKSPLKIDENGNLIPPQLKPITERIE